jgi:HK97 family phage major capsid protein
MSELVKLLVERRASLWEQAQEIGTRAASEKRDLSGEESQAWERINGEMEKLAERINQAQSREQELRAQEETLRRVVPTQREERQNDADGHNEQLRSFLRGEQGAPRTMEVRSTRPVDFRSLSKLTAAAGANTVQTSFYERLVAHMIETSAILRSGVTILNTGGGETLQIPKTTAHSTGAIVTEASSIGVSDPAFGQATLGAYKYGVMIQVSRELLDDSSVDLEGYLSMQAGRALGNAFGAHAVAGTGTNQPRGILTDATVGVTGGTTVAGVYTADNLIDLFYSVIAPYRNSAQAAWIAKDSSVATLRKIKDTTGQYIFQPSLLAGTPDTLLGKPLLTDPYMPATAVGAKSVLFGDLSQFFVRLAGGVRFERSDDYAFNTDLVSYRALLRADSALIDTTGAVKVFQGGAT